MRSLRSWLPVKTMLAGVAMVLTGGCAPLPLLNSIITTEPYHRVADVAYGSAPRQKLDMYVPKKPSSQADVIVFWYGGYWRHGHKRDYQFVGEALAAKGMLVVIPNYRLYPQVAWRGFVDDGARAYQWVEQNVARYGGNPHRVFVMGHSAGAYIAAMVALDRGLPSVTSVESRPCGMIGLAGPYAFLPIKDPAVQRVFSAAHHLINTQPIHYVTPGDPPLLLMAGADDHTVNPRNSYRLARAVRAMGGQARVIRYPGIGHIRLLLSLAAPLRFLAPALRDTVAFVHETACRP